MNKTEFIEQVVKKTGLSKAVVTEVVTASIDTASEAMQNMDSIAIMGFGTLQVKARKAREGYSPAKKQKIQIPAQNHIVFKPSSKLKAAVNAPKK